LESGPYANYENDDGENGGRKWKNGSKEI